MAWQTIVKFVVYAMLLTLAPGPDILTVIARSVSQGVWAGMVATLGLATGLIFHTTVVALGVGVVLRENPRAMQAIQIAGAGYLLYLAVRVFMAKDEVLRERKEEQR